MSLALVPSSNRGNRGGKLATRHDCGAHGKLTATEIAKRAGLKCVATVYQRLGRGVTGEDLVKPDGPRRRGKTIWTDDALRVGNGAHCALTKALTILRDFPNTPPSMETLRERFGMSRATAYRWRNAWLAVHGNSDA